MSAFIVEDKTINAIVSFLYNESWGNETLTYGSIKRTLAKKGYDLTQHNRDKDLAQDLFKLNCNAVNQRYGEGQAKEFRSLVFNFKTISLVNPLQVYKSLGCLIYQCSEGNIPETNLYKMLEEIQDTLARSIINRLPEYDKAYWG